MSETPNIPEESDVLARLAKIIDGIIGPVAGDLELLNPELDWLLGHVAEFVCTMASLRELQGDGQYRAWLQTGPHAALLSHYLATPGQHELPADFLPDPSDVLSELLIGVDGVDGDSVLDQFHHMFDSAGADLCDACGCEASGLVRSDEDGFSYRFCMFHEDHGADLPCPECGDHS